MVGFRYYDGFMEIVADIRELPPLDRGCIHIWGVHVPDMQNRLGALQGLLCQKEQEKAARFHRAADRVSSIAARGALRILLSGYTGIPADEIAFEYSENGKPHVADFDVSFNVSHSADWVVLAFGLNRKIGVDVERIRLEKDVLSVASRCFTPEEQALVENAHDRHAVFFQLWARKEAYVKACGSTLFRELAGFSVPLGERAEKEGWYFHRLEAGSKYAAAVVTDKSLEHMPCYDFGGLKWGN
jgi:4'-phosphopantetheinyl transferase